MGSASAALTQDQLDELRRWADGLVAGGADGELGVFARAIGPLSDEATRLRAGEAAGGARTVPVATLRREARAAVENGAPEQVRAAARAVLLLCDEIAAQRASVRTRLTRRRRRVALVGAGSAVFVTLAAVFAFTGGPAGLDATGPSSPLVGKAALSTLRFTVDGDETDRAATTWRLDGEPVTSRVTVEDGRLVYRPRRLPEGEHTVEVSRPGGLFSGSSAAWTFTVDTKAPVVRVTKGSLEAPRSGAYTLRGEVEPGARVRVNGRLAELDDAGGFALPFDAAPARTVIVLARDLAGNATDSRFKVALAPRLPRNPIRAVHVSADGWAHAGLRAGVLRLLDEKKINTVELDLKDESGIVGWRSGVPLARRIGAERGTYDLAAAVKLLHARGARVVGRLVAFRDPVLAKWAWTNGAHDLVIQTPDGGAYSGGYGGFTNYVHPQVQAYNVDLAVAAAKLGVDDVLYDYVRRPDGPVSSMVVPGLESDPSDAVLGFLRLARQRLAPFDTFLGASVFGIAATRPDEIAQDVPAIAREVDYVAPMLYPSHWGPYEYGVTQPESEPYAIVRRSLRDFQRAVRGSGSRVVPWLQDFSLGVQYGEREVRAQIDATDAAGIDEFLLWDPNVTYTGSALAADAALPAVGSRPAAPGATELVALKRSRSPDDPVRSGLEPNELGTVPVIMYHQLLPDGGGEYDLTPDEFRAELERLHGEHYRPITASAFATGKIDLPRGATPVVLTFDDSTTSQAALLPDGRIDPESAVGIILEFARDHPDFRPAGTFYVNRDPFGSDPRAAELARKLVALGFEFGNHTLDHVRLDELDDAGVQRQIVLGNRLIREFVPDAEITTIALPFGLLPARRELALGGSWDGESYRFAGAFLAGAEPSPSPAAETFEPAEIPRIRSDPADLLNGSSDWLAKLAASPELRYVSDGKS
ncbi:MAG TPA: putative glycoside hydrolase [Gaiellaceae bacterium]|nr:putative glycoside hydrolase [Gaiellaceae bacterium]